MAAAALTPLRRSRRANANAKDAGDKISALASSSRKQNDVEKENGRSSHEAHREQAYANGTRTGSKQQEICLRSATFKSISWQGKLAMLVLAIQFGFAPVLAKFVHQRSVVQYDAAAALLSMEIIKGLIAVSMLIVDRGSLSAFMESIKHWTLLDSMRAVLVPAILFSCQDYMADFAQRPQNKCDPLLYLIINQSKTLWAALLLRFFVGVIRSEMQWIALTLLPIASLLYSLDSHMAKHDAQLSLSSLHWSLGASAALGTAAFSSINQTWVEVVLRHSSNKNFKRDSLLFSFELSCYKAMMVSWWMLFEGKNVGLLMEGMNGWSLVLITVNGVGGLAVAMVNAHAGGDWKGYALIGGITLSGAWSYIVLDGAMTSTKFTAMCLVVVSLYCYNAFPVKAPPMACVETPKKAASNKSD